MAGTLKKETMGRKESKTGCLHLRLRRLSGEDVMLEIISSASIDEKD